MLSNHVVHSVPANNESAAPVTTVISVTFDDSIRFLSLTPDLIRVADAYTRRWVEGRSAFDHATQTLSFIPDQPLEHGTEYFVSHDPSRALKGVDQRLLSHHHSWKFTTAPINFEVLEVRY